MCMCVFRSPSFLKTAVQRSHFNTVATVAGLAVTEANVEFITGAVVVAGEKSVGWIDWVEEDWGGSVNGGDAALSRVSW